MKRNGANTSLCKTPVVTSKGSEMPPSTITALIAINNLYGIDKSLWNAIVTQYCNITDLLMESKAFLKSTKVTVKGSWYSLKPSITLLRMCICCAQLRPGLKPAWLLLSKGRLQNPTAGWPAVLSGSRRLSLFRTIETGRNRRSTGGWVLKPSPKGLHVAGFGLEGSYCRLWQLWT